MTIWILLKMRIYWFFATKVGPMLGKGALIIALTTLTYNSLTGEILDADIEYNSEKFSFTGRLDGDRDTDLMNTTVHELGHFLGLGHTADTADTMYPRADTGEIKKRTLTCNDARGLVFKYPADATPDLELPLGAGAQWVAIRRLPIVAIVRHHVSWTKSRPLKSSV